MLIFSPALRGPALPPSAGRLQSAILLALACAISGCGKEPPSDAELREKAVGQWSFADDRFTGTLALRSGGTAVMHIEGNGLNKRFKGDVKYAWKIDGGRLHMTLADPGNHLAQMFPWPAGDAETGAAIDHLDEQTLELDAGPELTRVP